MGSGGGYVLYYYPLISILISLPSYFHVHAVLVLAARGDRMKQAQTDADELIAAYKGEQQDAFDKAASASGKSGGASKIIATI